MKPMLCETLTQQCIDRNENISRDDFKDGNLF
jgi:hypothetical protein